MKLLLLKKKSFLLVFQEGSAVIDLFTFAIELLMCSKLLFTSIRLWSHIFLKLNYKFNKSCN